MTSIKKTFLSIFFVAISLMPTESIASYSSNIVNWNPTTPITEQLCLEIANNKLMLRKANNAVMITYVQSKATWIIHYLHTNAQLPNRPKKQFVFPEPKAVPSCVLEALKQSDIKAYRTEKYCLPQSPNSYYEAQQNNNVYTFDESQCSSITRWLQR